MSISSNYNFLFNESFLSPKVLNNSNIILDHNLQNDPNIHYTKVNLGLNSSSKTRTEVHAILDYDDDDINFDQNSTNEHYLAPIQGPIYLRNNSIPIIPQFTQPILTNGTLIQIPIFWNTLAIALGYELNGNVIRGLPCIKRQHQLFCPSKGVEYPEKEIEQFIDENKALMNRMYGELNPYKGVKMKRSLSGKSHSICESEISFETPFWAVNLNNLSRAIVNTEHFRQSIQFEKCKKNNRTRCPTDCHCEQKYSYHRLLAYDPQEKCRGVFMDWFMFPSCCVCSCFLT